MSTRLRALLEKVFDVLFWVFLVGICVAAAFNSLLSAFICVALIVADLFIIFRFFPRASNKPVKDWLDEVENPLQVHYVTYELTPPPDEGKELILRVLERHGVDEKFWDSTTSCLLLPEDTTGESDRIVLALLKNGIEVLNRTARYPLYS